jgi:subtilase family serine protease
VGLAVELPVWQMGVDMTTNGGSTIWRNVPDVALTAEDIYVIVDGQGGPTAGTSCAAPLWAGLMALVNQQAAQLGQQPVGFLNPMLYGLCRGTNYGAIFHDITLGNNTNACSGSNYYATAGFDLCTGWGTPAGKPDQCVYHAGPAGDSAARHF